MEISPDIWTDKERMFFVQTRPRIFKAIFTSILAFIIFAIVYLIGYLIIGGAIYLLSNIPLIGRLVGLLFFFRGDTPDMMLSLLCPGVAYLVTMATQEKINKDAPTRGLSCILLGIFVMLLHIASLIINLIYGNGILKNIAQTIAGFVIFSNGIGELKKH